MYCPDCNKNIMLVENSTCYTNMFGIWCVKCCKIIRKNKNSSYPEIDVNGPGKLQFIKKK